MKSVASFGTLLGALKAAAEPTRLRLLAVLREGELNVTDLTAILSQSQPRVSRHLKLLMDAGLIERIREGSWAFFRLREDSAPLDRLLSMIDPSDEILEGDRLRLAEVRRVRAVEAADYFSRHAQDWDRIRSLHVTDRAVEGALLQIIGQAPIQAFLDIGTGTGRMLELFAPMATRAVGIDASAEMLAMARANMAKAGLGHVVVRQADLFNLPVEADSFDLAILHQVLHYLDDGARAIREAAKVLRPGGRLVIVDFGSHDLEFLREDAAHRRLGFTREVVEGWMQVAGLTPQTFQALPPTGKGRLTVQIWVGRDPRAIGDALPRIRGLA